MKSANVPCSKDGKPNTDLPPPFTAIDDQRHSVIRAPLPYGHSDRLGSRADFEGRSPGPGRRIPMHPAFSSACSRDRGSRAACKPLDEAPTLHSSTEKERGRVDTNRPKPSKHGVESEVRW